MTRADAWATLFLLAASAAAPFALLDGLDKQAEINAQKVPDYCRAHPVTCDYSANHQRK